VLRAIAVYDDHEEETSLASGSGKMSLQSQVIYEERNSYSLKSLQRMRRTFIFL
jgi:hypothetical protein